MTTKQALKETIVAMTPTQIQEIGKCVSNPIRYAKILPKYTAMINQLWETFPDAETLSEAIYLLKNDMLEPPECPSCEKKLTLHKTLYRYGIYCDMKCRSLKTPLTRISVSVNGKIYPSIKDATKDTGISRYLLKLMLFDSSNSSCFYVTDHESTTQKQLTEMSPSLLDKKMLIQKKDSGMAMDKIAEEIGENNGVSSSYCSKET